MIMSVSINMSRCHWWYNKGHLEDYFEITRHKTTFLNLLPSRCDGNMLELKLFTHERCQVIKYCTVLDIFFYDNCPDSRNKYSH